MYVDGSSINKCKCFLKYIYKALFISCFESSWIQKTPKITDTHRQKKRLFQRIALAGHSTHFQVGGLNPKVEEQTFFYHSQGLVKGPFPMKNFLKSCKIQKNFLLTPLI
jgi:hypothetical protein